MLTTLFTFFGGTAFRLVFGSVMDWFSKRQDHKQEMEMQRLQAQLETSKREHELNRLRLQSDLGVREIQVATEAAEVKAMSDAFLTAVQATTQKTGVSWVDAWNAAIRPAGATLSLIMWLGIVIAAGFAGSGLSEFDKTMISAFLGIFVGDRIHAKLR